MDEYISKEAAIKKLERDRNKIVKNYGINDEYARCYDSVIWGVEHLPAADVKPVVRGEWVFEKADSTRVDGFSCSICGRSIQFRFTPDEYNFCPNCGADMRKEVNDER